MDSQDFAIARDFLLFKTFGIPLGVIVVAWLLLLAGLSRKDKS